MSGTQGLLYFRYLHTSLVFALRPVWFYSTTTSHVGNLPWRLICHSRGIAICPADSPHLSSQARWRAQRTYDVDPDTGWHHYGNQHHDPVSFDKLICTICVAISHIGPRPGTNWTSKPQVVHHDLSFLLTFPFLFFLRPRLDHVPSCGHHARNSPRHVPQLESSPAPT
jgi:hypothetical protein